MAKKIIRTVAVRNGSLIKFLPQGTDTWLSLEQAIPQARAKKIEAVVARNKNGQLYLRAKGDSEAFNNLQKVAIRWKSPSSIASEWVFAIGLEPDVSGTRPDPNFEWNTKPQGKGDSWAGALARLLADQTRASTLALPYMSQMFEHWQGNTGTPFTIPMNRVLYVSSDEKNTVNTSLKGAAEFAEEFLKVGQARTIMTQSKPRRNPNIKDEDKDLYWAVGGHTGWAKALIKKVDVNNFKMNYEYHLEDLFTFRNKGFFNLHDWHKKGLGHDFSIFGVWEKDFSWEIGKFDGKV